jgi:hypothetical protein
VTPHKNSKKTTVVKLMDSIVSMRVDILSREAISLTVVYIFVLQSVLTRNVIVTQIDPTVNNSKPSITNARLGEKPSSKALPSDFGRLNEKRRLANPSIAIIKK